MGMSGDGKFIEVVCGRKLERREEIVFVLG